MKEGEGVGWGSDDSINPTHSLNCSGSLFSANVGFTNPEWFKVNLYSYSSLKQLPLITKFPPQTKEYTKA